MAGYTLLKVLMVSVVFGSNNIQAQNVIRNSNINPQTELRSAFFANRQSDTSFINSFGANSHIAPQPGQPQPPLLRTRTTPRCAMSNDIDSRDDPCMEDSEYDDNIRNYINQLLAQTPNVNEIVTDPMLKVILNDPMESVDGTTPATRGFREQQRKLPVCQSEETEIHPKRGKTSKGDWVFVLNQANVKQALRVEKCINKGRPCHFGGEVLREVRTECQQKYVYRRLLTAGSNNVRTDDILMPSCCVCYFSRANLDVGIRGFNSSSELGTEVTSDAQPAGTPGQNVRINTPSTFSENRNTGNLDTRYLPPNHQEATLYQQQGGSITSLIHPRTNRNQGNSYVSHGRRYH